MIGPCDRLRGNIRDNSGCNCEALNTEGTYHDNVVITLDRLRHRSAQAAILSPRRCRGGVPEVGMSWVRRDDRQVRGQPALDYFWAARLTLTKNKGE